MKNELGSTPTGPWALLWRTSRQLTISIRRPKQRVSEWV